MTTRYLAETGKYYYVTPMSYMRLLKNFKTMHKLKVEELELKRDTYKNGVNKLNMCGEIVEKMKIELEALKPNLIIKTQETEEIMKKVEVETLEAEKTRVVVQSDEVETSKKKDIAEGI